MRPIKCLLSVFVVISALTLDASGEMREGASVLSVQVRLGGTEPEGIFFNDNALWFEVENAFAEEIIVNQRTYAQKENQNGWGYLEVQEAGGNPVKYVWNAKDSPCTLGSGKRLRNSSYMNGRPFRKSGPGQYKARLTLTIQVTKSGDTFQIQSNWHSFTVTPCGYPVGYQPKSAFEELRLADAYRSMMEDGHSTLKDVVDRYTAIIEQYPGTKYELASHFGIGQAGGPQSREHFQMIVDQWPEVVTHDTIHARNRIQAPKDWYQWLQSITLEQIREGTRQYFVWPHEPTEKDIQQSVQSILKSIELNIESVKTDPVFCSDGDVEAGVGRIAGRVLDGAGDGVGSAFVFICDPNSGIPLSPNTLKPLQLGEMALLHAMTDDAGAFSFDAVPTGTYRLVSQSWHDAKGIKGVLEVHGKELRLHGVADTVRVLPSLSPNIELRPLGTGILKIDADMPNDDTLLVVSTAPTQADPILGFAGWAGGFMQNMIGGNRMPSGETTIYGLPEGDVYFAMFAADNSPGFAEGKARIKANETTELNNIQFVAGWSDGRHEPPKELLAVFEEVKPLIVSKDKFLLDLFKEYGLMDIDPENRMWGFMEAVTPNLKEKVTLPSGHTATFGEIVAAWKYVELQQMLERINKPR